MAMKSPITILLLEDNPTDARLVSDTLAAAGLVMVIERVESRPAFEAALKRGNYALILSDYKLPAFDGLTALKLVREQRPDIPFILVSGTLGEEMAVDSLRAGATDYVLKHRLSRLVPAVKRALSDAEAQRRRREAEHILAAERKLLRTILDHLPDLVFTKDAAARVVACNAAAARFLGVGETEMAGQSVFDLNPPDLAQGYAEDDQRVLREGITIRNREELIRDHTGGIHWHLTTKAPLRGPDGQVNGLIAICRDITERRQMEESLRDGQALYESLVQQLPQCVFRKDGAGRFTFANRQFCEWVGLTTGQVVGKTDFDLFPRELAEKYRDDDARIIKDGNVWASLERHRPPGAPEERFVEVVKWPVRTATGEVAGIQGIFWDVTEREQAAEALRASERRLKHAQRQAHLGSWEAELVSPEDPAVGRLTWSDETFRIFGCEPGAVPVSNDLFDRGVHPEDRARVWAAAAEALRSHKPYRVEHRVVRPDGTERTVVEQAELVCEPDTGRPVRFVGTVQDITEQKQLEAQFLRAQRLEGIGALASGLAHDLNNILAPILMSAALLKEAVPDPESRQMLNMVEQCAQRGADILKQLLTFARGQPGARVPLPVQHLLREMEKLMRETLPRSIRVRSEAPRGLWPVLGDATQLHQALMNLCVNARDALPAGGELHVTAENLMLDEAFAAMIPDARPGPYVRLRVRDTGTGIAPEHLDHIFDPFFTTKEPGKGTGLGLATVLGIVRGHGGFIQVNSRPGAGTTFELYFPASPGTDAAVAPADPALPPLAQGEWILVVDDEAPVREVVERTLQKHGYRVVTAAEGTEALGVFARHRAELQAVITDLMMPGMDGPALARVLRQMEKRVPILGMTGVAERADVKGFAELPLCALLTKPFPGATLLHALHQALQAGVEPPG